jgi:hypothetical protein
MAAACGTVLAALGGLFFGIRAELRASRYRPFWEIYPDRDTGEMVAKNRTGETALEVVHQKPEKSMRESAAAVPIDGEFRLKVRDDGEEGAPHLFWVRPKTGQRYAQPIEAPRVRSLGARAGSAASAIRLAAAGPGQRGRKYRTPKL